MATSYPFSRHARDALAKLNDAILRGLLQTEAHRYEQLELKRCAKFDQTQSDVISWTELRAAFGGLLVGLGFSFIGIVCECVYRLMPYG